eukprot:14848-Rhodomonas_salina.2
MNCLHSFGVFLHTQTSILLSSEIEVPAGEHLGCDHRPEVGDSQHPGAAHMLQSVLATVHCMRRNHTRGSSNQQQNTVCADRERSFVPGVAHFDPHAGPALVDLPGLVVLVPVGQLPAASANRSAQEHTPYPEEQPHSLSKRNKKGDVCT